MTWLGIDYGSKLAGTTAVCYDKGDGLVFVQSAKKQDADAFLAQLFSELRPQKIFFDAPLSLPAAYFGKGEDFFYRQCDKETKAMSPMFLGGLTARAMKLAAQFPQITFRESYPGYLIRTVWSYKELYLKKEAYDNRLADQIIKDYNLKIKEPPTNWHQLDALVCWISGLRDQKGDVLKLGDKEEGLIYV